MNYTNWQSQVNENLEHNRRLMAQAIKAPVVHSDEQAKKFIDGLKKLFALRGTSEFSEVMEKSAEDVIKLAKDGDVKYTVRILDKAIGLPQRVITNTVYADPFAEAALRKDLHVDGMKDSSRASRSIDMGLRTIANESFDLGWTQAFTAESAEDVESLKLYDWGAMLKVLEYTSYNDDLDFQSLGKHAYGQLDPRYFAVALRYGERDMRFSAVGVNRILELARRESQETVTRAAYREIFNGAGVTSTAVSTEFSGATAGSVDLYQQKVLNGRKSLNTARVDMIDDLNGAEKGSTRTKTIGSKMHVPANSPILVYHTHREEEFIGDIQYMNKGVDTTKPTLYGNFAFVSTTEAPVSGKWTVTDKKPVRDEFGFYNTVKEATTDTLGAMLVIPGGRNIYATFRNLSLVTEMNGLKESTDLAFKQEFNFAMGKGQKRHVALK
jgi:hypothetical protein